MSFSETSLAAFKTLLAERLGDPGKVTWTDNELGRYAKEALQTWGSLALYWKRRVLLTTISGQTFYDLLTLALPISLTVQDLAKSIEDALGEPEATATWLGTDQFSFAAIQNAIKRRVDQFILQTGLVEEVIAQTVSAGSGLVQLSDATPDTSRFYWSAIDGSTQSLARGTARDFDSFSYNWSLNGGSPVAFSLLTEPVPTVQLAPRPIDNGTLTRVTTKSCPVIDIPAGTSLPLPDDFLWVIKWGVLADLLGETGIAQDLPRAQLCMQRWNDGLAAATVYSSVLVARIGGVQMPIAEIGDLDALTPSWFSSSGTPTTVALSNYNLLALYPISNSSTLELELDAVVPATLPSVDADYIQVGQDYLGLILDYAYHLATFKEGAAEFQLSSSYYQRLVQAAATYNPRLAGSISLSMSLGDPTGQEDERRQKFDASAQ